MATACIALGSNLGDRHKHLARAIDAISALDDVTQLHRAAVYETDPVGGPVGQGPFLNTAVRIVTTLTPAVLLEKLLTIEREAGRPCRAERAVWGPRPLDLDLLLYDDQVMDVPGLTVPHPRMHERWFVLKPLADIAAQMRHPVLNQTIEQLLGSLDEK